MVAREKIRDLSKDELTQLLIKVTSMLPKKKMFSRSTKQPESILFREFTN